MKLLILAAFAVSAAVAGPIGRGADPHAICSYNLTAMKGVNENAVLGLWYVDSSVGEYGAPQHLPTSNYTCLVNDAFSTTVNNKPGVILNYFERKTSGSELNYNFTFVQQANNKHLYTTTENDGTYTIEVIKTDYSNYLLLYFCNVCNDCKQKFWGGATLYSRHMHGASKKVRQEAAALLTTAGWTVNNSTGYIYGPWTNCKH